MEARHPGRQIRTTDAIERTSVVVLATLVAPGMVSPGPPGAQHVDDAGFRVERTLTPGGGRAPAVSGNVKVSYTRQIYPEAEADAALERGGKYVLFCTAHSAKRLHALKIVPHTDEALRVVASAFEGGARHGEAPRDRIA